MALAGIHSVLVALLSEKADVQYAADHMSPDRIVLEIQGLGFGAQLISESEMYQEGQIDISVRTHSHSHTHSLLPTQSYTNPLSLSLSLSLPLTPTLSDIRDDVFLLCSSHREDPRTDSRDREICRDPGNGKRPCGL